MTCIIGYTNGKTAYIGADSAGSDTDLVRTRKDPKIFNINGVIFGGASSYRMLQLIKYNLIISNDYKKIPEDNLYDFVCQEIVPGIQECLKGHDDLYPNLIIGIRNKIFSIQADYNVGDYMEPYTCTGSGDMIALGSLFSTYSLLLNPIEKIELAISAAAHFCMSVELPIVIMSTQVEGKNK